MRFALLLILALLAAAGCAEKGISVKATSDDRDIFRNPEGAEAVTLVPPPEGVTASGRAPFVHLGAYDWDYAAWLADFSDAVAGLRLPDSTDTFVDLRFVPGDAEPEIATICTVEPEQCAWLEAQLAALGELPPLPDGFPQQELTVRLSRLP